MVKIYFAGDKSKKKKHIILSIGRVRRMKDDARKIVEGFDNSHIWESDIYKLKTSIDLVINDLENDRIDRYARLG